MSILIIPFSLFFLPACGTPPRHPRSWSKPSNHNSPQPLPLYPPQPAERKIPHFYSAGFLLLSNQDSNLD